jgi:hypothetical protein
MRNLSNILLLYGKIGKDVMEEMCEIVKISSKFYQHREIKCSFLFSLQKIPVVAKKWEGCNDLKKTMLSN